MVSTAQLISTPTVRVALLAPPALGAAARALARALGLAAAGRAAESTCCKGLCHAEIEAVLHMLNSCTCSTSARRAAGGGGRKAGGHPTRLIQGAWAVLLPFS